MIKVEGNDGSTIFYKCDCGINGKCMFKPLGDGPMIVVTLKCASCDCAERIVLVKYESEKERDDLLKNLDDNDLTWCLILSNEVV